MSIHATGAALDSLAADAPQFQTNGGDWDEVLARLLPRDEEERMRDDRIVLNMGPVHPSTHGVLRLVLEVEGEHVTDVRVGTGYLHTGIEKNMEFRTFTPRRHLRNPYGLRGPPSSRKWLGLWRWKRPWVLLTRCPRRPR